MRTHNEVAIARMLGLGLERVYRIGEVPKNPPTPYHVVSVDSGASRVFRKGATSGSRGYRLVVQFFGKTYNETAWAAERADLAFEEHVLDVPTFATTPCRREIATNIMRDPDAGSLLYGTHTYTFTSNPTE